MLGLDQGQQISQGEPTSHNPQAQGLNGTQGFGTSEQQTGIMRQANDPRTQTFGANAQQPSNMSQARAIQGTAYQAQNVQGLAYGTQQSALGQGTYVGQQSTTYGNQVAGNQPAQIATQNIPGSNVQGGTQAVQGYAKQVQQLNLGGTPQNTQQVSQTNGSVTQSSKSLENATDLTPEEKKVNEAVNAIVDAIKNLNNGDIEKTNAAMNLLGTGREVPKELSRVVDAIKECFDEETEEKAFAEIRHRYQQRMNFVGETMKQVYGQDGEKLLWWMKS
jgi:hypothetical protein